MRTPEQGHTKKCLAEAIICAVENYRDAEDISDIGFRLAAQDNFLFDAEDYYDGLFTCTCPEDGE